MADYLYKKGTSTIIYPYINIDSIADGLITGAKIAASTITGAKLAASTITLAKMAASSVDTLQLINSCVTSGKIASNAVTEAKIANNAVTTNKIADSSVTTPKIALNAVTSGKIAAKAIRPSHINIKYELFANAFDGLVDSWAAWETALKSILLSPFARLILVENDEIEGCCFGIDVAEADNEIYIHFSKEIQGAITSNLWGTGDNASTLVITSINYQDFFNDPIYSKLMVLYVGEQL